MQSQSVSFTGTISGNGLTLQLSQRLSSTTSLTGRFIGSGFTLTYPGSSSGLIATNFGPAQLSDYNQAVSELETSRYSSPCTLYAQDHDTRAEISGNNTPAKCASFVQAASSTGDVWTTGPRSSGSSLSQVCDLANGGDRAVASDDGGKAYGQQACNALSATGWASSSGATVGTTANGESILLVGCALASEGAVTSTCYYTAGPITGPTQKPVGGTYFPQHDCMWQDIGRNAAGALELFECR